MKTSTAGVFVLGALAGAVVILGAQRIVGGTSASARGATPAPAAAPRARTELETSSAPGPGPMPDRVATRVPDLRRELAACRGALASHATLPERFDAADVDVDLTAKLRAKFAPLMTGPSTLDSFECRNGVCLARVTNADADPAFADRWLADFQARRGDFFTQMRVRTLPQGPDSTETELMFEPPTAASSGPVLAAVLAKVSEALDTGVPGCEHGRASVELRASDGVLESEVIGSECLTAIVDAAARDADVRGKSNSLLSQIFRW